MPYLSIIVPVYNKEKYIDDCIKSILAQTFTDFEFILVNDGSTDGSFIKCKQYQQNDSRIILIDQPNGGVSSARNAGLAIAKGDYIGFIDSDDNIEPDMYALLVNNARKNLADISVCAMRVIFPYKNINPAQMSGPKIYGHSNALAAFFRQEFSYSANNKIIKARLAKQIKFKGRVYEDILFMCKVFLASKIVVFENIVKYNYIVRDNSVSMSGFDAHYFETVNVSAEIVKLVSSEDKHIIAAAKAFDVSANISLLNLLLMAGKDKFQYQYKMVVNKLKGYAFFIKKSKYVHSKHRYAFILFNTFPKFYAGLMYLYCRITRSEVIARTK